MAWSETLLDCSFRGFVFDVIQTQDTPVDRATAEHTYPFVDGANIEDLGANAKVFAFDAFFWGDDYEQRLQDFLAVLAIPGTGELIHPVFGSIKNAQLLRATVRHAAEHVDQCAVSLEFKEDTPGNPFFERALPSQLVDAIGQPGLAARSALADALGNLIDTLRNNNPLAALSSLRQQMLGPVLATLSQVNGVLLSGLDVAVFPRAWANDLSSIVDGMLDLRDFGDSLITDWSAVGNSLALFDTFSSTGNVAGSPPVQVRAGVSPSEAQAVSAVQAHITCAVAVGVASAAALVLTAEADPQHGPTLSPPEIELVVDGARSRIEVAIAAIRVIYPLETARTISEPLKDQALALQAAAAVLIEARPPLILRSVDLPGNLRLQAHRWYGDHTRATELARLNPGQRNPNLLDRGDTINAYAR